MFSLSGTLLDITIAASAEFSSKDLRASPFTECSQLGTTDQVQGKQTSHLLFLQDKCKISYLLCVTISCNCSPVFMPNLFILDAISAECWVGVHHQCILIQVNTFPAHYTGKLTSSRQLTNEIFPFN